MGTTLHLHSQFSVYIRQKSPVENLRTWHADVLPRQSLLHHGDLGQGFIYDLKDTVITCEKQMEKQQSSGT